MSSEYIYDKQFVKAKDVFFPIILCGSSNCFECGNGNRNGRRSRSWWNDTYMCGQDQPPYATREQIMARVDEIRQRYIDSNEESNKRYIAEGKPEWCDTYDDKRFGYWAAISVGSSGTRGTSFAAFKSLFKTGMDKALTVEQLAAEGIYVEVSTYQYWSYNTETKQHNEKSDEAMKCEKLGIELLKSVTPRTTEMLLKTVDHYKEHYKDTGIGWSVTFTDDGKWFERSIRIVRQKYFPKGRKEYETKQVDHYYTVVAPKVGGFFIKFTSRGYRYSSYSPYHKFETEKQAEQFAKTKAHRLILKVELINSPTSLRVVKKAS
jgi:hypothetical protein